MEANKTSDCRPPPPQIPHHNCVGVFEKGTRGPACLWESCGFPIRKRHPLSQLWDIPEDSDRWGRVLSHREASPGKVSLSKVESTMTSPFRAAGTSLALTTHHCFPGDTGSLLPSLAPSLPCSLPPFLPFFFYWKQILFL